MLPSCLEQKVFKFVHFILGHSGVDKCIEEIKYMFHVRNLGGELRKFIAHCDVCQRCKHPNRSFTVEERNHLTEKLGDVCAIDIYRAYLHQGEKCATFLYATMYFLDMLSFIPLDMPPPKLV
jgi:hypothetical protein